MLVRTIGFTIIFGLVLHFLMCRRWRRLISFTLSSGAVLGPWMAWSYFHNGGTFHSYVAENAITWKTPISHFWMLATATAPTMTFAPLDTPLWRITASRLHLGLLPVALGLGITALVVAGWIELARRRHVVAGHDSRPVHDHRSVLVVRGDAIRDSRSAIDRVFARPWRRGR